MDPEVWKRVKDAIVTFEELPEAKQSAFVESLREQDPECYEEALPLLEVEVDSIGFLGQPLFHLGDEIEESTPFAEGEVLGPYRLGKRLGSGGMGTVYKAQTDGDSGGPVVAVKILKRGLEVDELRRRFHKERRILGYLNHPNIAKLLDYGMTDDGRPYLVMEFIEGEHITTYCDRNRLSIRERLKIFQRICASVQYAHQNLIIHRDLKPGNILVTPYGEPKLLDFGIAKLLDPEGTKTPVTQTMLNLRPMTPDYASPEQVRGAATSTTCDIYALGVVLYELLTGRRPYRLDGCSDEERTRIICEVIPDRPSVVVTPKYTRNDEDDFYQAAGVVAKARGSDPKRLSRRLRGDIDTIVAKALRKEPERRYGSAEQLSADIERHMQGFPLLARRESSVYSTKKFIRRHGVLVGGVLTTLLVLFAFSVVVSRQNMRLKRQRDIAEEERERLVYMLDSFQGTLELAGGKRGDTHNQRTLAALTRIRERAQERSLSDRERASKTLAFGMSYAAIGEEEVAQQLLEEAVALHRIAFHKEGRALAQSMLTLARFYLETGQYQAARTLLEEALALIEETRGPDSWQAGEVCGLLAEACDGLGFASEARPLHERALRLLNPFMADHFYEWAAAQSAYADHFLLQNEPESAVTLHQTVLTAKQARVGQRDLELIPTLLAISRIRLGESQYEASLKSLSRAYNIAKQASGRPLEMTEILQQQVDVYQALGRWDALELTTREALTTEELPLPETIMWRRKLATALAQQGRSMEAEAHLADALTELGNAEGTHPAPVMIQLASLLRQNQAWDEAEAMLKDATLSLNEVGPHYSQRLAAVHIERAALALDQGRLKQAEIEAATAVALTENVAAEAVLVYAKAQWVAATIYLAQEKLDLAEAAIESSLGVRQSYFENPNHWQVIQAKDLQARIQAQSK